MVKELIKALKETKAEVESLEARIAKEIKKSLAKLHTQHGFESVDSFVKAVKEASREAEASGRKAGKAVLRRAKRAKITADVRALVKKLAEAGKTGADIAKAAGISLPSVQNIKKALGLVKTKKKKAAPKAKPKAPRAPAKRKAPAKAPKKRAAPKKASPVAAAAASAPTETAPPASG
jgi:hypothetical protein